jgi:hypothetical protein
MEAGGCYIGTVGKMRGEQSTPLLQLPVFNTNCPSPLLQMRVTVSDNIFNNILNKLQLP